MTYAEKQGALNIQTIFPCKEISKEDTYGFGDIAIDGEFIRRFPEFQNKLARYEGGQMSKDELLVFYFSDAPQIAKMLTNGNITNPTILDEYIGVDMDMLKNLFGKKANGLNLSEAENTFYDKQSVEMHSQYVLMTSAKGTINLTQNSVD